MVAKSLIQRDPDADVRTRQHMDLVAEILNSLLRQGQLQPLAPPDWTQATTDQNLLAVEIFGV